MLLTPGTAATEAAASALPGRPARHASEKCPQPRRGRSLLQMRIQTSAAAPPLERSMPTPRGLEYSFYRSRRPYVPHSTFTCDQQFRVNVHQHNRLSGIRVQASTGARRGSGSEAPGSTETTKFQQGPLSAQTPAGPAGVRGEPIIRQERAARSRTHLQERRCSSTISPSTGGR